MADNPCPPPGKTYSATNGRNDYQITVQITNAAWMKVPVTEQDKVISVLSTEPVTIMPDLSGKGNGIKRESDGWSIHTQSDKSLYDTNIRKGDAAKKNFAFEKYQKRPH